MKKVTLFISRNQDHSGYYNVIVSGEGFFDSVGKRVGGRVRGDDQWFDETLFGIGTGLERVLHGGVFGLGALVHKNQLNEDWGRDEIYAIVEVQGGGSFKTNTVTGYY